MRIFEINPAVPAELPDLPALPGSYLLGLALDGPARLTAGRLGVFDFPAGVYVYAGSAHGPGGLRARLAHHARAAARPHWHLDYLRLHARLLGGLAVLEGGGGPPLECAWSRRLAQLPGVSFPAPGFGAADCRSGCAAHLALLPYGLNWPLVVEQAAAWEQQN